MAQKTLSFWVSNVKNNVCLYQRRIQTNFLKTMSHVSLGERVYVKGTDMFGDVTRTTVLGVTAVSLVDDEGTTKAFFPATAKTAIVGKDSGMDGTGATVDVPVDVRQEGVAVLGAMGVPDDEQRIQFIKFMGMFDQETRRAYMDEWLLKKDDPTQRAAFLQGLMTALQDDQAFITRQGNLALSGVEPDVRQTMFGRMITQLTKEDRESLILEWMDAKNDIHKKEEFLQGMYELLMDDDDYIAMEGRKAFTGLRILQDEQTEIFTKFMTNVSAWDRAEYVADYRRVRKSESEKKRLLQKMINLANGDAVAPSPEP